MKNFTDFLKETLPKEAKNFGGFFVGEKVLYSSFFDQLVYVCGDFVSAGKIKKGLQALGKRVEIISCGRENDDERDANLSSFARSVADFLDGKLDVLIFLPSSVTTKFDVRFLKDKLSLKVGEEISLEKLAQKLSEFGFERVDTVSSYGQFAVRGDVVDVFFEDNPTRVEFFDEEIEKIVNFDFSTLKTLKICEEIEVQPIILKFGESSAFDLCENVVLDEPTKIENECKILATSREEAESFCGAENFLDFSQVNKTSCIVFSNTTDSEYENQTLGQKSYITDFMGLKNDILTYSKNGLDVFLFAGEYFDILREFLLTNNIAFDVFRGEKREQVHIYVVQEYFPYSFSFLQLSVVGIGTDDMYRKKTASFRSGRQNFAYLPKVGDLVVHSFYGVGRCKDIVRMKLSHIEKDYFVLEYRGGALLYLPSEQANLLTAYVGGENPKLNALGTNEWTKLKQKVKENLKELAVSLAKVYKEREEKKGYKFERDNQLEEQFAREFPFELTPDQTEAIQDVENDMTSGKIMDRLICGDVGFGKTEVAYRAMFKAVYNSKQVAFLCPTTILSEQHFRSTKARMASFGLRVEVLNRFKTAKETAQIYKDVADGKIDILIGTHKILNAKLKFKDLGLLVLDEEQRFGVKDKEKIKSFKTDVDVLTLSATPIPRTLHMSLSGIRDISVIATPPKDRLPIQTYVCEFSSSLMQDVISRELSRKGKALVLYNQVASIYQFKYHLQELLPNARIGVAHGQMEERELAKVIDELYEDKFDILLSTTLIENGIDLPALNTLFVVDCDRLGLGQLYQIRGRIGRSDKLAYAYLTYDGSKVLTEDAYKRLEAIKEFRELGSGFKIAMRDLEIRGAGNVLGKEQHGHMQKVGYDMYIRLLEEVTREVSGEKNSPEKEIKMELMLDAYISEEYVPVQEERIILYTKISQIRSALEFDDVTRQMKEVYGELPKEARALCKVAYLKNLAAEFNVKKIRIDGSQISVFLYKDEQIIDKRLSKLLERKDVCLKFEDLPILKVDAKGRVEQKIDLLIKLFSKCLEENL